MAKKKDSLSEKKNTKNTASKKNTGKVKNRKPLIVLLVILGVLVAVAVILAVVLHFRNQDTTVKNDVSELVEMMADLVNEPVSDDDEAYSPSEEDEEDLEEIYIKVNKTRNCITVYEKDSDGEFTVPVKAFVCSVGYDTPTGTYETSDRYTWKIVNGNVWSQYATRITGNVLFHSVVYSEKSKSSLIASYYNKLGTNMSATCIRLMVSDAKWLMEHCTEGTQVEIYEASDPGPLGKPATLTVSDDEQWDPSDPDSANPWNSYSASISGATNRTVERNIDFDYLAGLTGTDTVGNDVTELIEVETDLDVTQVGTYRVTYTLTDGVGNTDTAEVVYTVADTMAPVFSGLQDEIVVAENTSVTKTTVLQNVYVADNNEILPNSVIEVEIPDEAGQEDCQVTISAEDDYGNVTTVYTTVVVDDEPPQIYLYADAVTIMDNSQVVNEEFALSRVYATDGGEWLSSDAITVVIYDADWGYTFVYTATDKSGQTATLTSSVTYRTYTLTTTGAISVTELSSEELMEGVTLMSSAGEEIDGESVSISLENLSGNVYTATYTYEYSSPLGTRTATTTRSVTLTSASASPSESASPSASASASATESASSTASPTATPAPTEAPEDDDNS